MAFVVLYVFYNFELLLQCFIPSIKFTKRDITFPQALIPFYYWIHNDKDKTKKN